jgi:RNase P/RNase MRP subunit p30
LATKESVEALEQKVDAIVVPSTDNLATKESVEALTKRVDAIVVPSDYYTKTEIDNLIGVAVDKTNTILND